MPRLFTPFYIDYPDEFVPSLSEYGPGTLIPWRLDLSTNAGRKQLDVAVASKFRITTWQFDGTLGGDTLNETQTATLPTASSFFDERELAMYDWIEPDSLSGLNQLELVMGAAASWGPKVSVDFTIILTEEDGVKFGYVSCQFEGIKSGTTFSSTQYGPVHTIQSGTVTFTVPGWPDSGDGPHSLTTPLYSNVSSPSGTFTVSGVTSLEYADGDGNAIWDTATAAMLRNPITSHIRVP